VFGFIVSPDHPPAVASRRYSGADKKEKQKDGKQQPSSEQQPGLTGLLFLTGNDNGADALHRLGSKLGTMMRESAGIGKPSDGSPSS
jgi:hypothetical protein